MNPFDILIIDDEEGIREVVSEFAAMMGFTFQTAENAQKAIEILSKDSPSLIICDISMPGMSGLDLLEKVRVQGFRSAVVMLTAYSESDKIIRALQLGALDYVCKPFNPQELMAKFTPWVEIGKRLQDLHNSKSEISRGDISHQLRMIELFRLKSKSLSGSAA